MSRTALIVIYTLYGSSFILLSCSVLLAVRRAVRLKLVAGFGFLALFGALHGLREFCDLYVLTRPPDAVDAAAGGWARIVSVGLLLLSFAFLLQFALVVRSKEESLFLTYLPWALVGVLLSALAISGHLDVPSTEHAGRWFLGTSASLASAAAMATLGAQFRGLGNRRMALGAFGAAAVFVLYGLFASWHWPEFAGVPIQVCRTACAVSITAFLLIVLRGFWIQRAELR